MSYHKICSLSIALAISSSAAAQDGFHVTRLDTMAVAEHTDAWHQYKKPVNGNPARGIAEYTTGFSRVTVSGQNEQANRPLFYQTGRGAAQYQLQADTYLHLSKKTSVWGAASYTSGKRRAVKWNSTADFLLLYPYVMGDTLGGNLSFERYAFTAGWASTFQKITIGALADFRAEHEYRTVDPRPRNIVTDFTLRLGASAPVSARYAVGLSGGMRFYKQTNDVAFYNEAGVIPEYHFLGLGMDYKRFSGSNASTYYKATGYEAGVDVAPAGNKGLIASAVHTFAPYHRILPKLNALPISVLGVASWKGEVGWRQKNACNEWLFKLAADYEKRTGNEQIAGNSSSNEYRIVGELTTYKAHSSRYYAFAGYAHRGEKTAWHAAFSAGAAGYAARYVFPERKMNLSKGFAKMEGQFQCALSHGQLLSAEAMVEYYATLSSSMLMPYTTMSDANTSLMDYTFSSAKANLCLSSLHIRWTMPWQRYAFYAELGGGMTIGNNAYSSFSENIAVGLNF